MVGAGLFGKDVAGLAGAVGLQLLLQSGFEVTDRTGDGHGAIEESCETGLGGLDDFAVDELCCRNESAVEVNRGYDCFERVGEQSRLAMAARVLFAAAEAEHGAKRDPAGYFSKIAAADREARMRVNSPSRRSAKRW